MENNSYNEEIFMLNREKCTNYNNPGDLIEFMTILCYNERYQLKYTEIANNMPY